MSDYVYQEYPKWIIDSTGKSIIVESEDEEIAATAKPKKSKKEAAQLAEEVQPTIESITPVESIVIPVESKE